MKRAVLMTLLILPIFVLSQGCQSVMHDRHQRTLLKLHNGYHKYQDLHQSITPIHTNNVGMLERTRIVGDLTHEMPMEFVSVRHPNFVSETADHRSGEFH